LNACLAEGVIPDGTHIFWAGDHDKIIIGMIAIIIIGRNRHRTKEIINVALINEPINNGFNRLLFNILYPCHALIKACPKHADIDMHIPIIIE
jgi:hypothetical protein